MNKKGFTFIEVLIGLILLSFLAAGSLTLFAWVAKEGERTKSLSGRNIENEQMLEHLTQPVYFGHLADYSINNALKACLSADMVLCDVTKDYPLTAMDLSTGQPMEHVSGSLAEGIKNTLSFRVHCPLNQATCDQPEYFVVKVRTEVSKAGALPYSIEKTALVVPEITGAVTFTPDTLISPGRNVNVVMFLDNSNSLLYMKDKIRDGLKSLLEVFPNLNTRVAIYSLYGRYNQWGKSIYYTLSGSTRTEFPMLDINLLPDGATFYEEMTMSFNYRALWYPGAPNYYGMVDFLETDDASTKALKIAALDSRIESLYAQGMASIYDTSLCQMLQIVESNNAIIPMDPQIPTVFLLITNENDETKLAGNIAGGTYASLNLDFDCYRSTTAERITDKQDYAYLGKHQYYKFRTNADFIIDGAPVTTVKDAAILVPIYDAAVKVGDDCMAKAPELNEKIKSFIYSNYSTGDVVFLGTFSTMSCEIVPGSWIMKFSQDPDLCTTGEAGFVASYPQYIPLTCSRNNPGNGSNFVSWKSIEPVVSWSSVVYQTQDTPLAVYNSLAAKGILNNIFFISVINPSSGTCVLSPGASYGVKYERLVSLLGTQGEVVPICSSDYSAKLKSITQGFVDDLGRSDIEIPLSVAASLKSIEVIRGSTILYPVKGVDYNLFNTTLIFKAGYLQLTDVIKVYTQ